MSRVITFSRTFPSYHPRAGEPTYFVEKVVKSLHKLGLRPWDVNAPFSEETYFACDPKFHTIRAGHRWKAGDWFSPRVWSGKPYNSKMIQFAPDIQIKKVWDIDIQQINEYWQFSLDGKQIEVENIDEWVERLHTNDGLNRADFINWFVKSIPFDGQIICWNENIEY